MNFEPNQVKKTLELIKPEGQLCEVRIINNRKQITSGYFKNHAELINSLNNLHMDKSCNVYLVLNTIDESCYSREQRDKFIQGSNTTSDTDIKSCEWFFVDVDPIRATGISSTSEELDHARDVAKKVVSYLKAIGFYKPIVAMSGNGYHLLYRINLENAKTNTELIKSCLELLSDMFSDDIAKIDTVNYNASRVCKLYGTMAQKGSNSPDRPHRMSKLVSVPDVIEVNSKEQLELLSNQLHKVDKEEVRKKKRNISSAKQSAFNLDDFLYQNGITYKIANASGRDNSIIYRLDECVFDPSHKDGDAKIFVYPDGAMSYKCQHNSCACYKWQDFRMKFDADYNPDADTWNYSKSSAAKSKFESDPDELPFVVSNLKSHTVEDLNLDDVVKPEFIVDNLLSVGVYLLNSPPKNGKSRLTLQLLIDICKGQLFLETFKTHQCECLYLALEDEKIDFEPRLKEFLGYSKLPKGFHYYLKSDFPNRKTPRLGENGGLSDLVKQEVKEHPGIKFVAVDVLGCIRSKRISKDFQEDEKRDVDELMNLASELNICILVSHHVAKSGLSSFRHSDSATGSGAGSFVIGGSVIGELSLIRDVKDRKYSILRAESRRTPSVALYLLDDFPGWTYQSTLSEHIQDVKDNENGAEMRAIIETAKYLVERDETWSGNAKAFITENQMNKNLHVISKPINKNSFNQTVLFQLKQNGINYQSVLNGRGGTIHRFSRLLDIPGFEEMPTTPDNFDYEVEKFDSNN